MTESNLESVLKIFSFEKKGDLEKHCRSVVISSKDFFALVVACEPTRNPFSHEISYRDKVSEHLNPSDSEIQALKSTPAGSLLTGDAKKAVRKMSQMFEERRYLVGHMFFTPDLSKWHFFSTSAIWRPKEIIGRKVPRPFRQLALAGTGREGRMVEFCDRRP
jgi:hypothetical protein